MKRAVLFGLVMCLLLCGYGLGYAGFGATGAINFAKLTGDDVEDVDSRTAIAGGIYLVFPVSPLLAFQGELLYAMKGGTVSGSDPEIGEYDFTFKLDYIEVPLLVRINVPTAGVMKPFLVFGPALGFNTSAKGKLEALGVSFETDLEDVKDFDIGLVLGGGVGFPLMGYVASVGVRYEKGLSTCLLYTSPSPRD